MYWKYSILHLCTFFIQSYSNALNFVVAWKSSGIDWFGLVWFGKHSFETENKIFAQEAGKVTGKENSNEGTNGVGWYQYVGDDGKVYRVEYEAGVNGFIPKVIHFNDSFIFVHLN